MAAARADRGIGGLSLVCDAVSAAGAVEVTDWIASHDELAARRAVLTAAELDALGLAAWFLGREAECEQAWDAAHLDYLDEGETDAAIPCVFWLGFTLADHGEAVRVGRVDRIEAGRPVTADGTVIDAATVVW